jgi:lipopolysaccharide/colanic/teichoic acid biosynthesis glycosyltransferase
MIGGQNLPRHLLSGAENSISARPSLGSKLAGRPPGRFPSTERREPKPADRVTRLIDMTVAAILLIILAPLMLLIAVLIRVTSRGPALFKQTRVGYLEQPFVMLKFRSMTAGCSDDIHREFVSRLLRGEDPRRSRSDGLYKLQADHRVTPLGRLLRATSLDELPQLINVLRGDMALVGPRPALAWEVALFQPHHHARFTVKPGITGLWQVSGRCKLTMTEALELDMQYIQRRNLTLDLWILMKTFPAVFSLGATR